MTVRPITTVLVAATAEQGAGPYDLTDLATIRLELSITDNSQDAWLQNAISQVSLVIANYCNRVFPVETIQDAIYYQMDPYPYQVPGGNEPLTLSRFPLVVGAPFSGTISGPGASTITGV